MTARPAAPTRHPNRSPNSTCHPRRARAVMIGRAYLWGMAAGGERGVSNVLEILRQGISETLYGLGKASVHDVTRDDVIVPDGFSLDHKL